MKKYISILILLVCLLSVTLSSCKKEKIEYYIDDKVAEIFKNELSADKILKDVKNIDFYYKPDTKGLKSEVVRDEENFTEDTYWKNSKGETVYVYYDGYGEKCFDYYTKSKSGRKIKVKFCDNDNKRYSVDISCDDYSVGFSWVNKESKYGADDVYINIPKNSGSVYDEYLSLEYYENKWSVCDCRYADSEGYKRYWTYFDDEEKKFKDITEVIYKKLTEEPICSSEILTDSKLDFYPNFVLPCYQLSYLGDADTGKWYITADFILTFSREEDKQNFADKYNIKNSDTQGNEGESITLRTGKITIPIADDFENFKDFVNIGEIDDWYYVSAHLNENGELTGYSMDGTYSYY